MAIIDQLNGSTPQALSLEGRQGPNFENEGQRPTSPIQAFVDGNYLMDSEGLWYGRNGGNYYQTSFYAPPSEPPVSVPDDFVGEPYYPSLGGPYSQFGPADGRY